MAVDYLKPTNDIAAVLNKHSVENDSDTPDFILAGYLVKCLEAWNAHVRWRRTWWGSKEQTGFKGNDAIVPPARAASCSCALKASRATRRRT